MEYRAMADLVCIPLPSSRRLQIAPEAALSSDISGASLLTTLIRHHSLVYTIAHIHSPSEQGPSYHIEQPP